MANVLDEEKQQQILPLGRLGWTLRRIEQETGVRRETASRYLKKAGIEVRPPGPLGQSRGKTGHIEVFTDSGLVPGRSPTANACEPHREFIEQVVLDGRDAMAIWQDLVDDHKFPQQLPALFRAAQVEVHHVFIALQGVSPEPGGLRMRWPGAASVGGVIADNSSTEPLDPDTDSDGLGDGDGDEVDVVGTDPNDEDTDDDGVCDGENQVGACISAGPDNCPFIGPADQTNSDALPAGSAHHNRQGARSLTAAVVPANARRATRASSAHFPAAGTGCQR